MLAKSDDAKEVDQVISFEPPLGDFVDDRHFWVVPNLPGGLLNIGQRFGFFPFEEKAIQIHESNVQKIGQGVYDQWVEKSLGELNQLLPVRYAKGEKGETFVESVF